MRGFSLMELAVVVAILGILSAVVSSRFVQSDAYHERVFVVDTAAALRYAQKIALHSGCDVAFQLNTSGTPTASLLLRQNANLCTETSESFGASVTYPHQSQAYSFLAGSDIPVSMTVCAPHFACGSASNVFFYFNPKGQPMGSNHLSADVTIDVNGAIIEVDHETGFVHVP